MNRTIEFKWDILERIKRNSKDWELDKGKESGRKLKFDCVKSFMETDACYKLSIKYGLDSEIVASFCESFATHVDLPKEKWFKYHPPIELKEEPPEVKEEKTIEFRWDLLDRIKCNSKDWELDKGNESGIILEFDCVKSFMATDAFHKFSTKYGLDSEIVATFCESFATHVDLRRNGLSFIHLLN